LGWILLFTVWIAVTFRGLQLWHSGLIGPLLANDNPVPDDLPPFLNPRELNDWRRMLLGLLMGMTLLGALMTLRRAFVWGKRTRTGGLIAVTSALGLLFMAPVYVVWLWTGAQQGTEMFYCANWYVPLGGLWLSLAALLGGRVRKRELGPANAWTERYGLLLGGAWAAFGLLVLYDVYAPLFR